MAKYSGRGIVFQRERSTLAQVLDVGKVGFSRDLIDGSAYGDDWKDWLVGQKDGDEVAVRIAIDPALPEQETLRGDADSVDAVDYQLYHAESGWWVNVPAIITAFSEGASLGEVLEINLTLKIVNPGVELGS